MNYATVTQIVSILAISMTLWTNSGASSTNVTFGGECDPNKTGCKDCYIVLKESLLKRDGNIRNLSETFFPPQANLPQFVEVTTLVMIAMISKFGTGLMNHPISFSQWKHFSICPCSLANQQLSFLRR